MILEILQNVLRKWNWKYPVGKKKVKLFLFISHVTVYVVHFEKRSFLKFLNPPGTNIIMNGYIKKYI